MKGSLAALALAGAMMVLLPAVAAADVWEPVSGTPPTSLGGGTTAYVQPDRFRAYTLDDAALENRLDTRARRAAATTLTLPAPDGSLQRFAVEESPIMEPGLAAAHPEITTYSGRGIDDPTATIRADLTPLGFHASVRSPKGAWYIDPYYHLDDSVYVTYYGRDLTEDPHGRLRRAGDRRGDRTRSRSRTSPPGPRSSCAPTASRCSPTPATRPTSAAAERHRGQGDADEPRQPGLRGRDGDPPGPDRRHRQAQLRHRGDDDRAERAVRGGGLLHAAAGDVLRRRDAQPHADRHRPGDRRRATTTSATSRSAIHGGGVASLGVVGGNGKAQGCTGLPTPVGDFFAVDYVAHEMGHQFAGNHTFNGTQTNCSGGNRNAANSVEPGSGSSIMAYAGICQQDNLQPHSDPYWSQRSFQEITAYVTSDRAPISEVQTVSLRDFDADGDSFRIRIDGQDTAPIVRGVNYTLTGIQEAIQGPSEVQTVRARRHEPVHAHLRGLETVPIVPGQNNTAAGIQNAIQGGNEQQQVVLTGFAQATQSFQIQLGGGTSVPLGAGGLPVTNNNVAAAINVIPGFPGTAAVAGAGNGGFTVTFAGASANTDIPSFAIVNCTGTCVATVRETAKGGTALRAGPRAPRSRPAVATDTGFTLTISGTLQGMDVALFSVSNGTVTETVKGAPGLLPPGATGTVAAFGGAGALTDAGFQVTFGGSFANLDQPAIELVDVTRRERLRRRDRTRRPDRQQGSHGHADRQPRAGRDHRRPASRSRCARRSRSPAARPTPTATRSPTCGSRTTAAAPPARRSSTTSSSTARCSASSGRRPTSARPTR